MKTMGLILIGIGVLLLIVNPGSCILAGIAFATIGGGCSCVSPRI